MKRSSLVGPLILILLGALFLLNNLRPELPLLDLLATFWPFLLIGWGVLRLAEILYWAAAGKPLPAAGVSGGEWAVIVLLCVIGSGLYMARRHVSNWPWHRIRVEGVEVFGETYDFTVGEQKKMVGKTPRVLVENFRGNARIVGADTEEIKVSGRKTVRAYHQHRATEADRKTPLEIVTQGDVTVVRTASEQVRDEYRVSTDLEIAVPRGARVEGRGRSGDFDVTDIDGAVEISSDNAGVRLNKIGGSVRVDLRRSDLIRASDIKGGVELKGRGQEVDLENIGGQVNVKGSYTGEVHFKNLARPLYFEGPHSELRVEQVPGHIRMALGDLTAHNLVGPVRLNAKSRDVQISGFTQSLEISVDRGDIDLRPGKGPLPKMKVETHSGNVVLALPAAAAFDLKATTKRGEVQNDFGTPLRVEAGGDGKSRGETLLGSTGAGPELRLTTSRGAITVRKATAEDEADPASKTFRLKVEQQ
jgi:DUF4097 and DUF4098 domain-containing protein YvlB